ncbi:MAG TPA: hypothetical protein ENH11_09810, partial [Candidatus Acetothermia bacterium]|nr:hypothetical protein [Candidatus Acetothermia bacterium]
DRIVDAWYVQIKGLSKAPAALWKMEPNLDKKLSAGKPNLEDIVSRHPDLVLTNPTKHGDLADRLISLGIPAIQYVAESPEATKEAMLLTGEALGPETAKRAQEFAAYYDRTMAKIADATKALTGTERLRVYFCGSSPLRAASGDMYQSLMVDAAGGVSVTAGLHGYWNDVNIEQILIWNPDVIIITSYGGLTAQQILNDPDWQSIPAVKNGRVYKMPALAAAWDTPVPDSLLGIMWLADKLYPSEINIDLASECRTFYRDFYGYTLSDEEGARLTGK